jgi:hypothetical protein
VSVEHVEQLIAPRSLVDEELRPPSVGLEAEPDPRRTHHRLIRVEQELSVGRSARSRRLGSEHLDDAGATIDEPDAASCRDDPRLVVFVL